MDFLQPYLLFLAKILTFVISILLLTLGMAGILTKTSSKKNGHLTIEKLNDHYSEFKTLILEKTLSKKKYKAFLKQTKNSEKDEQKESVHKKNIFILKFSGDIHASQTAALREEVTAILLVADAQDEVFIHLKSPGGTIPGYGLAAAQIKRLKDRNIQVTISVDEIAASGGYLMAAVADYIIASPFAILGSIGVVGQLPNFYKALKKNHIDYELHTAGEFKRTLTLCGENTSKAREKFKEELEEAHTLFKKFLQDSRPKLNMNEVATGEYWYGTRALELNLIDKLISSDEYLMNFTDTVNLYKIKYKTKQTWMQKLKIGMSKLKASQTLIEDRIHF